MDKIQHFKHWRWLMGFSVSYFLLAAVMSGGVYHFMRSAAEQQIVDLGESANVAMARGLAQALWPRFGDYVMTVAEQDGDALRARPETATIHAAARQAVADLPILKLKMFNKAGLTIYSSDASQIGDSKHKNSSFLGVAQLGVSGSKMSHRDTFGAFSGTLKNVVLVETYAPIFGKHGEIEGVFELYTNVTDTAQGVYQRAEQTLWMLLAALALGYLLLLAVFNAGLKRSGSHYGKLLTATPDQTKLAQLNNSLQTENGQLKQRLQSMQSYLAERSQQPAAETL